MNQLGIHCQRITDRLIGIIRDWQPAVVVWVDPDPVGIAAIRAASPGTFIVGRKFEEGVWHTTDLKARAYQWADACAAMGHCDAYLCWNEPFGHDSAHEFAPFDEFQMWFRERVLIHGMEAVGLNMATGNFTRDGPSISASFPETCRTFPLLGIHEYSWPSMRNGEGYYCNRWPHWLEDIGRDDVRLLVTECGMTQAVIAGRPDEGWRSGADGVTDGDYLDSLSWYNAQLVQDARVMGAALFNFEGHGWATFEHADWPRLPEVMAMDAPPPPEPPNGDDDMEVKIFDMLAQKQDKEWMHRLYAVDWERAVVEPGQKVYRLVLLREKEGPHALVTQVVGEDDGPLEGVDVAFYWSDAPDPPDPPTEVYPHDWHRNFTHGPTNVLGDVGPGMGTGAYHGPGECGPHQVWVRDPNIPSDRVYCLGMLAGTNHRHMDQRFKLVVHGEEPPIPPVPPDDAIAALVRIGDELAGIRGWLEGNPPPDPPGPPEPDTDFFGQYYNNITLSDPVVLERWDEAIDFRWGSGSPGPGIGADYFSVHWRALKTFTAGTYRFHVRVDDGVRLKVDGGLLIDSWKPQGPTPYQADAVLTAGQHVIEVDYYEQTGGSTIELSWEKVA